MYILCFVVFLLSIRAFHHAPTSSSLSCQSGEQWTALFYSRAHFSSRPHPLTNLHALSKKYLSMHV